MQGKRPWLDLSEEPFYVFFQLLGTVTPLIVRLPPKCTTNQALIIFEETFRGIAVTCKMVMMPTAQYPTGKILAEDERLDGYGLDKKMKEGPVLMIFGKPASVRVGVSRHNAVERIEGKPSVYLSTVIYYSRRYGVGLGCSDFRTNPDITKCVCYQGRILVSVHRRHNYWYVTAYIFCNLTRLILIIGK